MSRLIHPVRAQMTELSFKLDIYPLFFDVFSVVVVVMQTHTHAGSRQLLCITMAAVGDQGGRLVWETGLTRGPACQFNSSRWHRESFS